MSPSSNLGVPAITFEETLWREIELASFFFRRLVLYFLRTGFVNIVWTKRHDNGTFLHPVDPGLFDYSSTVCEIPGRICHFSHRHARPNPVWAGISLPRQQQKILCLSPESTGLGDFHIPEVVGTWLRSQNLPHVFGQQWLLICVLKIDQLDTASTCLFLQQFFCLFFQKWNSTWFAWYQPVLVRFSFCEVYKSSWLVTSQTDVPELVWMYWNPQNCLCNPGETSKRFPPQKSQFICTDFDNYFAEISACFFSLDHADRTTMACQPEGLPACDWEQCV